MTKRTHVLLWTDTPTAYIDAIAAAGLTDREIAVLRDAIQAMCAAGVGVLLVEHNTTFVFDVADEVTVLHQGKAIAHGSPEEIAAHEQVIAAYLGSSLTTRELIEESAHHEKTTHGPGVPAPLGGAATQRIGTTR